jgi:hypothetical protein
MPGLFRRVRANWLKRKRAQQRRAKRMALNVKALLDEWDEYANPEPPKSIYDQDYGPVDNIDLVNLADDLAYLGRRLVDQVEEEEY